MQRDLDAEPTAEEHKRIMDAQSMYSVSITMLGSCQVKITGDESMIDEVGKHLAVVMAARHAVRWPSHWAPQQRQVQLFSVDKSSSEGAAIAAEMSNYNIVKV